MPLLEARAVEHGYRRFPGRRIASLRGVDLVVEPGQCWGLVGPNGSGKSTLLRLCAGLAEPSSGRVTVKGVPAARRAARQATAYAPETVRWPRDASVVSVLRELAGLAGTRDAAARVQRAVRLTGLEPLVHRRLGTLSLGQGRRVVLAQALLDEAPLLLLDEPFSGLDSLVILDVREHLARRLAGGAGVVMASHRLEDLEDLATHVLVLRDGRATAAGPAAQVLADARGRRGMSALLGASGRA
jgi:ABC-type multidrug transport system ATPase subunit